MTEFSIFLPLAKVEKTADGGCIVSGYASTPSLDLDGEIISLDAVKKALPGYWEWRNIREMHQPSAVGIAKDANVDDRGLFLTSKIVDPIAAKKCLDGVYKGYSIGGKKLAKKGNTITEIELVEVSIVDRPANPDCRISVAKRAKEATNETGAVLLKCKQKDAKSKALAKLAKTVEILAKDGPPAAHDGFSLPAKTPCKDHNQIDCAACMSKGGDAPGDGSKPYGDVEYADPGYREGKKRYPIDNEEHIRAAWNYIHKPKNSGKYSPEQLSHIKSKIEAAWKSKVDSAGPPSAKNKSSKKSASLSKKKLKKLEKRAAQILDLDSALPLLSKAPKIEASEAGAEFDLSLRGESVRPLLEPDRLSLGSEGNGTNEFGFGHMAGHEDYGGPYFRGDEFEAPFVKENRNMNTGDKGTITLESALAKMVKRASAPSRAQRLQMAMSDTKRANKARKAARSAVEDAYKLHKRAYLAKAARTKKNDGDADDFDHAGAMEKLQKAYTEIRKMGDYLKSARGQITKVARVGQRGQEAGDAQAGVYEVPAGVKDLSRDALAGANPGEPGSSGLPPKYPGSEGTDPSSVYAGKFAKGGLVPVEVADLLAKNAKLEAERDLLARSASNPRRPASFDMNKLGGAGSKNVDPLWKAIKDSRVDPSLLVPEGPDENPLTKKARAEVVGTYLLTEGNGKSLMDPNFRGGAAGRA